MASVRVDINDNGIRELLRSAEGDLRRRAERIAAAAGPGHVVDSELGRERARAVVITATPEAMEAEATQHRLTRSIDAGR